MLSSIVRSWSWSGSGGDGGLVTWIWTCGAVENASVENVICASFGEGFVATWAVGVASCVEV